MFGISGICFLNAWLASAVTQELSSQQRQLLPAQQPQHSSAYFLATLVVLLAWGGGRSHADTWWQRNYDDVLKPVLVASCVVRQDLQFGTAAYDDLWQLTRSRVHAHDDIILWSEEAVDVTSPVEEQQLLTTAQSLLAGAEKTYLGLAYEKLYDEHLNNFILVAPGGNIAWNYTKRHPVPLVESDIARGTQGVLPTIDTPFGRLGGAVCYDFDFPDFIHQAGRQRVDILLQPSWTWGPTGEHHWKSNAVRAVENGATMIRCSSGGVSGVVSPYYDFLQQYFTGANDFVTFKFPQRQGLNTVYSIMGVAFDWLCLGLTGVFCLLNLVPLLPQGNGRDRGRLRGVAAADVDVSQPLLLRTGGEIAGEVAAATAAATAPIEVTVPGAIRIGMQPLLPRSIVSSSPAAAQPISFTPAQHRTVPGGATAHDSMLTSSSSVARSPYMSPAARRPLLASVDEGQPLLGGGNAAAYRPGNDRDQRLSTSASE